MIRVITVEREYGSGGGLIAKRLAEHLGWQVWDHAITCDIAKRLKCDVSAVEKREERCDTTLYRLMKTFMRGSYEDQLGSSVVDLLDAEHLAELFETMALDIAKKGNAVIVGRGSTWYLRNRPDVFHLFVYASRERKIENLRKSGHSESEAEDLVERVDRERAAFIKKYYDMNWPTRELYHMMINSGVGADTVVRLVLAEIEMLNAGAPTVAQAAS